MTRLPILLLLAAAAPAATPASGKYRIQIMKDGAVEIGVGPVRRQFAPEFTILSAENDPKLSYAMSKQEAYVVPEWNARQGGRTMDLFQAAVRSETIRARSATWKGDTVVWEMPSATAGKLEAELKLPGGGDPQIRFRFTPAADGWYSIGYTGAPATPQADIEALWQPLIWQGRRFPRLSFLSVERMCSLPAAIVSAGGATVAVAADPGEVPFRFPSFEDSRFGVLLRSANGQAQPALFAPVLGSPPAKPSITFGVATSGSMFAPVAEGPPAQRDRTRTGTDVPAGPPSRMKTGEPFEFRLRLVLEAGGWYPVFRHIAEGLYRFRDYRENTAGSLNDTLENMVAFAMNDVHAGWVEDLRGFDYTTDVAGTVKVVSALHPLSVALLTDSRDVFRRRALPVAEYLMSREKYLFSIRTGVQHQNPSHYLRGPAAEVSELAALYAMSGGRSSVFRHYAEALNGKPRALNLLMVSEGGSWQNELALYRMSGDKAHLDRARSGADRYIRERIDTLPSDFSDVHIPQGGQFWTDFTPKWIDLFELYEETRDAKYLAAAAAGARDYATFSWFAPAIPDADVTVNRGDKVGVHGYIHGVRLTKPMRAPEQQVPAWRVSQNGLVPEASTTYTGNPAVFLAHHAAYMLRIGEATRDPFLKAVARSAIVGRYANYPGYDINGEYTTVYERPDYPARPFTELTYNNIYYNHVWPQIALVFDYLISDIEVRSGGRISFPSRYAQGYAYLQSKVYGDRAGVFYGNPGVQPWMPAKLLRIESPQINYVSGYDRNALYIAFSNQSSRPVTTKARLNVDLVPYSMRQEYGVRTWRSGSPGAPLKMRDGEIAITVPASGLVAVAIDGIRVAAQFQPDVVSPGAPLSDKSYSEIEGPFGKVTGMVLSFGAADTSGYVWLAATGDQAASARLHYRTGASEWAVSEDARYPYEFRVPLDPEARSLTYWVEVVPPQGGPALRTETVELQR